MRIVFYILSLLGLALTYILHIFQFDDLSLILLFFMIFYISVGAYDVLQTKHTILRMYPVIGHIRYMLEYIRAEIQQYFIANDTEELPFNREIRSIVYQRSKNALDTVPFGTKQHIEMPGYLFCRQSLAPKHFPEANTRVRIGNKYCKKPYTSAILNISAMSFGALSSNAIMALNKGAKKGNFYHNTGEGGLSPHHKQGGDLCFQLGTAYFGCRTEDGGFDKKKFKKIASQDEVKMIELKLSQGAKPSHGGILPKEKISKEIAEIRGIPLDKDCLSPPAHSEFDSPHSLLKFIKKLRDLSEGKPVGFKLCIGKKTDFMSICKAMVKTKIYPDFITVDGSEGGTGAAPLEFTNRLGITSNEAVVFVHNCLVGINIRDQIKIIVSGKVATGFHILEKLAIGADICNTARPMMFALGCIQSLNCHNNSCPTGIATQSKIRSKALFVEDKAERVYNYHRNTMRSFRELAGALGVNSLDGLEPGLIYRRNEKKGSISYLKLFPPLKPGELLSKRINPEFAEDWKLANEESF
ncbi:MAG: FMN-binding glutamate synthase family protein [Alphaproteobacteria bacterium]|nr:FMN-binding glutamate synthase family protein [Alphaproteobacteria bacterium]